MADNMSKNTLNLVIYPLYIGDCTVEAFKYLAARSRQHPCLRESNLGDVVLV
jgi:hypothetical protein